MSYLTRRSTPTAALLLTGVGLMLILAPIVDAQSEVTSTPWENQATQCRIFRIGTTPEFRPCSGSASPPGPPVDSMGCCTCHTQSFLDAHANVICEAGENLTYVEAVGYTDNPSTTDPPPGIALNDEGAVEIVSTLPPIRGATRDRYNVDLYSGSLEFTVPTGINLKGRAGHDLNLDLVFRSGVYRPDAILGPFWNLNIEDFLFIERLVDLGAKAQGGDPLDPIDMQMDELLKTTPYINRIQAGRLVTYTNIDAIKKHNGFLMDPAGELFVIPSSTYNTSVGCWFDYQLKEIPHGLLPPGDAVYLSTIVDPVFHIPSSENDVDPENFCVFLPQAGRFEKHRWNCNGQKIRTSDGTINVYSAFYKRKDDRMEFDSQNPGYMPNGGRGLNGLSGWHELVRVQLKARLERVEYPDGNRLVYFYDDWGRLESVRDVLGRRIRFIYETAGGDPTSRIQTIKYYESGDDPASVREVHLTYMDVDGKDVLKEVTVCALDHGGHDNGEKKWQFNYILTVGDPDPKQQLRAFTTMFRVDGLEVCSPEDVNDSPAQPQPFFNATWDSFDGYGYRIEHITESGSRNGYEVSNSIDYSCEPFGLWEYGVCWGHGARNVTVTDACGNDASYTFDRQGNQSGTIIYEAPGSPDMHITKMYYDPNCNLDNEHYPFHLLRKIEYPKGNSESYTYKIDDYIANHQNVGFENWDMFQFGNLLKRECKDGNGDVLATEEYTYEPAFNQIMEYEDPNHNHTQKYYRYMECDESIKDDWLYLWHIDWTDFTGFYATDIDENGFTGTIRDNCLIKTVFPVVTQGLAAQGGNQTSSITYQYNAVGQVIKQIDEEGTVRNYQYYPKEDPNGDGFCVPVEDQVEWGAGYLEKIIVDPLPGLNLESTFKYDFLGNTIAEQDPRGYWTVHRTNDWNEIYEEIKGDVDSDGNPLSEEYESIAYDFDYNGNITQTTVRCNNPQLNSCNVYEVAGGYVYDAIDQLREMHLAYASPLGESGTLSSYVDYDGNGNVVEYVKPNGTAVSALYNYRKLVWKKTRHGDVDSTPLDGEVPAVHADDATLEFSYDDNGNLDSVTDDEGDTYTIEYDGLDRRVSLTEPTGTITEHDLDAVGNIEDVTITGKYKLGSAEVATLRQVNYDYDEKNRLYKVTESLFELSEDGVPIAIDPIGLIRSRVKFNRRGDVTGIRDYKGVQTDIVLDAAGREVRRTHPELESEGELCRSYVEYELDANGNAVWTSEHDFYKNDSGSYVEDAVLAVFREYDALNRMTKMVTDPAELQQTYITRYDSLGNAYEEINPLRYGTRHYVDTAGRVVRTEHGYNVDGNDVLTTGALDPEHNADGLVTKTTTYDGVGNVLSEKDDSGNVTGYVYDNLNRRVQIDYSDGTYETVSYRADDLPEIFQAFDDQQVLLFTVTSQYSPGKQRTQDLVTLPPGSLFSGNYKKNFEYDGVGRVLRLRTWALNPLNSAGELVSVVERKYDSMDNVLEEAQKIGEDPDGGGFSEIYDRTVEMTYDGLRNRLTVGTLDGSYGASYEFDNLSRISRIGFLATYEETDYMGPAGRIWKKTNGNGTRTRVGALLGDPDGAGYDALRRPARIQHVLDDQGDVTVHSDFKYAYDLNNNRLFEDKAHNDRDLLYNYDAIDRLVHFDEGAMSPTHQIPSPDKTEAYGLDGVGNRLDHGIDGVQFDNVVDSMNRYTTDYNDGLALAYDARGNTTQYGALDLTYDVQGRIVAAEETGMAALYLYDGFDRRLMKRVNGDDTFFVMEGDRVIQEVDGGTSSVTKEYAWGSGIDELVMLKIGSDIYHAHADAIGSMVLLTDSGGGEVERYDYTPFGDCTATDEDGGGLVGNPYRFTGRRLDAETGLYYFRARHYSRELGRFLSRDPIGAWGDAGNLGNSYSYTGNNPVNWSDPSGLGAEIDVNITSYGTARGNPGSAHEATWNQQAVDSDADARACLTVLQVAGVIGRAGVEILADTIGDAFELATGYTVTGAEGSRGTAAAALFLPGVSSRVLKEAKEGVEIAAKFLGGALEGSAKHADDVANATDAAKAADGVEAVSGGAAQSEGKIYRVDGDKTPSGKKYIGRTIQASPEARGSRDGRDRAGAEVVDGYDASDTGAGRRAEQNAMNREGGIDNLDNKRNEIRQDKWEENGISPPSETGS